MTDVFKNLMEEVDGNLSGGNKERSTVSSILLRGLRYEGDVLIGINIKTGDEIKVMLREIKQNPKPNSSFKRIEIEEFADKNNRKRYVDASTSEFLVEDAYLDNDGIYKARWLTVLKKMGLDTVNLQILTNYSYFKNKSGQDIVMIKMLSPKRVVIKSESEFMERLADTMRPKDYGSSNLGYVNITKYVGEDRQDIILEVRPTMIDRPDGIGKMCASGEESTNNFLINNPSLVDLLRSNDFINGDIKISLLKGSVMFPGGDTKESILNLKDKQKEFIFNQFKVTDSTGKVRQGFKECIISTRTHKDGVSRFFTNVKIVNNSDPAKTIDEI